jgi:signal transduction histidine kinase
MVTSNRDMEDVAAIARIDVVPSILEVVCRATGMGFSAVARVTEDRWIACAVRDEINFGLVAGGELRLESTICNEIRQSGALVVIDEVACDEAFHDHHTPKTYGFQSYISVPIRLPGGTFFGTLCAIDPRPARLTNVQTIGMFKLFADLIGLHLDAQERLSVSEAALVNAHQRADLQSQFVAVLGHDLRNPLSAIQTGAKMLLGMGLEKRAGHIAEVIDRSAARMTGLIDNVLDFARSRLGGGLSLTRREEPDLRGMLDQVVSEMRTIRPDRTIHSDIVMSRSVFCDRARVGQLFSNLLSNALTHGDPVSPVWVRAATTDGFELSVTNLGAPIAPDSLKRLFQPFARGGEQSSAQGLGLGLYIASEIARAHGGALEAVSTAEETRFTLRLP